MDLLLASTSCTLTVYALLMIVLYLTFEKGGIFDPIPVSWAGYIIFVALAMLAASILPGRQVSHTIRSAGCALTLLATLFYTIGLYVGRGTLTAQIIPVPPGNLTKGALWFQWIISACGFFFTSHLSPYLNVDPTFARVFEGMVLGFLGAATLTSLLALLSLKRSPFTKSIMALSTAVAAVLFLQSFFSRRPLLGLVLAVLGFIYLFKISGQGRVTKITFFALIALSALLLNLYLKTTRSHRFYGSAVADPGSPLSLETLASIGPDVQIGYLAYEFALEQIPDYYGYLYGSGIVPAFLFFIPRSAWPSKPVGTGYFISQLWFGTPAPASNLSPLPLGELYVNFGVVGLILGPFLAGKIVRITNSYLNTHSGNAVVWLAWLMVVPDFASEWRGDFTSMTVQAFLRVTTFIGVTWLTTTLLSLGQDRHVKAYEDIISR